MAAPTDAETSVPGRVQEMKRFTLSAEKDLGSAEAKRGTYRAQESQLLSIRKTFEGQGAFP